MQQTDVEQVMELLRNDYVIKAVHDMKSEEIGPGIYRFKAEMGAPACLWAHVHTLHTLCTE